MIQKHLQPAQFDNVIRWVNLLDREKCRPYEDTFGVLLRRIKVNRDFAKAVPGIPLGSDTVDWPSIVVWAEKVKKQDVEAVAQMVAIDATIQARLYGA